MALIVMAAAVLALTINIRPIIGCELIPPIRARSRAAGWLYGLRAEMCIKSWHRQLRGVYLQHWVILVGFVVSSLCHRLCIVILSFSVLTHCKSHTCSLTGMRMDARDGASKELLYVKRAKRTDMMLEGVHLQVSSWSSPATHSPTSLPLLAVCRLQLCNGAIVQWYNGTMCYNGMTRRECWVVAGVAKRASPPKPHAPTHSYVCTHEHAHKHTHTRTRTKIHRTHMHTHMQTYIAHAHAQAERPSFFTAGYNPTPDYDWYRPGLIFLEELHRSSEFEHA